MMIPELNYKDFHYVKNKFLASFTYSMCFLFAHKQDLEHNRWCCSVGDHVLSS